MPNIDKLTRVIIIEKRTTTDNAFNEKIETWATHQKAWAEVRWLPSRERFSSERTIAIYAAAFFIRYISGLNAKDYRINYDGRIYNIIGIKEDNRGKHDLLELTAEAKI